MCFKCAIISEFSNTSLVRDPKQDLQGRNTFLANLIYVLETAINIDNFIHSHKWNSIFIYKK